MNKTALLFIPLILPCTIIAHEKIKLLLHFDVNKTILADDPAGGKSVQDALIHCLADQYKDIWDTTLTHAIPYSEYVKECLLPGERKNRELKIARDKKISRFIEYLKETKQKDYQLVLDNFNKLCSKLSQQDGIIFASFYNLINYFTKNNIDFSIILRTFGDDLPRITQELERKIAPNFFSEQGNFSNGQLQLSSSKILKEPQDIYNFYKTQKHVALQDSYQEWNSQNEHHAFGKRFHLDLDDAQTISIFFDDNINQEPNSSTNIVSPLDAKTGNSLDIPSLIEKGHLVVVDTLAAILDDNYFIDKVAPLLKLKN